MKQVYFLCLLSLSFCTTMFAQRGKNGPLVVTSTVVVNEYTSLTANAAIGNTSITVANSALNAHSRFSQNLGAGDLVMIIQMQGASINGRPSGNISTPNDSSWGAILNYNNCGNNEIREVLSVPNGTTINLTCPLVNNYTAAGKVQIVRIPRYSTLTINVSGEIVPDSWDSVSGGIIAIEVLGNTVINTGGQINAGADGFRGGVLQNSNSIATGISYVASNQPNVNGAYKGESIAGNGTDYNVFGGGVCMGAPANGGGGGNSWNGGGGGGANGGNVSGWINGFGIPDISQPGYVTAWNLEYTWMSSFVGAGGGRGGYTWSGSGNPLTLPPGNPSWAGDSRRSVGGRGGHPLDYSTGRLFFGGGGGAGSEDNNHAGPGGNGGGLIYLISYGTVSGGGMILANGHNGVSDSLVSGDGPGGAGAGGTILVNSTGTISGITIEANGGTGGSQRNTAPEGEGPGGGGGGGYIATSNVGIARQVIGGPNGATTTFPTFPANGSTKGGPGDTALLTNFTIVAHNDSICKNTAATLIATLIGTVPVGTTIEWYDSATGGSILGSGPSFSTPILNTTTVFYVATCPGDYRQADTVFIRTLNPLIVASPDSICKGDSALLIGSGGITYLWSTSQTKDSIKVAPLSTTTYTLTAYKYGCNEDTTFTLYVRPQLTASINAVPDTVCVSGLSTLTVSGAGGQVTYKWNNGHTYDSIHVRPLITTTYTATIYGRCDTITKMFTVHVAAPVMPLISGKKLQCKGIADTLIVSGTNSYLWSNGSTTDKYITGAINADSIITVIGFSSLGCPDTARFTISILPAPVVSIVDTNNCLYSPAVIHAISSDTGLTYLWTPGGETNSSITEPDTGQKYTLTVSNGCTIVKTIRLAPVNPTMTACCSKTIFAGDDTILVAHGDSMKSYTWSPAVDCLNPSCDSVKVAPSVTTTYTVTAKDSLGCAIDRIVTIVVETPCFNFTVPNVFTPTNAGIYGLNNIFYIKTTDLSSWSIVIYDRWGKEMFKSSNPNEYWDGKAEGGGTAPSGVYYYILDGVCQGNTYKKQGYVQLIR